MHTRLLSLLAEIEDAILAGHTAAGGDPLDCGRMVNFQTGLARLQLRSRAASGAEAKGQIQLQHFSLADGRACIKAALAWHGCDFRRTIEIYVGPDLSWATEVQRVAEAWLDGPATVEEAAKPALAASG